MDIRNKNILITRPLEHGKRLGQKIQVLGGKPQLIPTLEINPIDKIETINYEIFDKFIFISQPAVYYGLQNIKKRPSGVDWIAIGPQTAKLLYDHNIENVVYPKEPPFNSETLLSVESLNDVKNKKILIFKGRGGRLLLENSLGDKQAQVTVLEVYTRTLPFFLEKELCHLRKTRFDVIITTSGQGLDNLVVLNGPCNGHDWLNTPIMVVGGRSALVAHQCGFKNVIMLKGAQDEIILDALAKC